MFLPMLLSACAGLPSVEPDGQSVHERIDRVAEELAGLAADLEAAREERRNLAGNVAAAQAALSALPPKLDALEQLVATEKPPPAPASGCEPAEAADALADKQVVGRREEVWIEDLQLALPARIDTGAETASLDARAIREFERDGDEWVRFDIVHPGTGEPLTLERPVARVVRILQSTSEEAERRVVIELGIVLGEVRQMAEFTLSDRSHLDFQMLVGRNILKDLMVVDVGQSNIAPYRAAEPPAP
ncbi:MAG: ATP-dependent zinc protease family protein [Pseudohaliea sp.]